MICKQNNIRLFLEKTLVLALGTLVCFLLLEFLLRARSNNPFSFENRIAIQFKKRKNPCLAEPDIFLGWRTGANRTDRINSRFDDLPPTYVSSGKNGWRNNRNHSIGESKPVLVYGDSFTFGDEVNDWETWPAFLEEKSKLGVYNFGTCGFGLDQSFLLLKTHLETTLPKLVIFSVTPDMIDRLERPFWLSSFYKKRIPKPFFRINNGQLVLQKAKDREPDSELERFDLFRSIFGRSWLIDYIFRAVDLKYWWGISGHLDFPKSEVSGEKIESLACLILKETNEVLKSKNIKLILLSQSYFRELKEPNSRENLLNHVFESCLMANKIATVHFSQTLSELYQSNFSEYSSLFIRPRSHMSPQGNQLVAEMLYQKIKTLKNLPF